MWLQPQLQLLLLLPWLLLQFIIIIIVIIIIKVNCSGSHRQKNGRVKIWTQVCLIPNLGCLAYRRQRLQTTNQVLFQNRRALLEIWKLLFYGENIQSSHQKTAISPTVWNSILYNNLYGRRIWGKNGYMYNWITCCTPETNTTLYINYILI